MDQNDPNHPKNQPDALTVTKKKPAMTTRRKHNIIAGGDGSDTGQMSPDKTSILKFGGRKVAEKIAEGREAAKEAAKPVVNPPPAPRNQPFIRKQVGAPVEQAPAPRLRTPPGVHTQGSPPEAPVLEISATGKTPSVAPGRTEEPAPALPSAHMGEPRKPMPRATGAPSAQSTAQPLHPKQYFARVLEIQGANMVGMNIDLGLGHNVQESVILAGTKAPGAEADVAAAMSELKKILPVDDELVTISILAENPITAQVISREGIDVGRRMIDKGLVGDLADMGS